MSFLLGAGVLLFLVVAVLAWALLRKPHASRREDVEGRMEAELTDDVAAGVLAADDLRAATADIEVDPDDPARERGRGGRGVGGRGWLGESGGGRGGWRSSNWSGSQHGG